VLTVESPKDCFEEKSNLLLVFFLVYKKREKIEAFNRAKKW
jgi:hypothetical protein